MAQPDGPAPLPDPTGWGTHVLAVEVAPDGALWVGTYGQGIYVSRELLARRAPRMVGWLSVEHPFSFDNRRVRLLSSARRYELGCPSFAPIFALGPPSST